MIEKNGFNIVFFVITMLSFSIFSCKESAICINQKILLQTDREFSTMSEREGMFMAFLAYIAEDGVILRDNSFPSKGKESLREYYTGKSDTSFTLAWEPISADISASSDLGYTYGTYTTTAKVSGVVSEGTYVTIWKKQSDGTWKFVLDTGTEGLPDSQ
ncbi:MAG TPA: DUF4440 domain-containing protein [Bacteroidales bacterium]|nr:DUF4440 domain-containing protein [Bacteroidales bacterium]